MSESIETENELEQVQQHLETAEELTDQQLDTLEQEAEAVMTDIGLMLIDNKCPTCNAELMETRLGPTCPRCVANLLGRTTLSNSLFRVRHLLKLYYKLKEDNYSPTNPKQRLLNLIPACLAQVDLFDEFAKMQETPSRCKLSANQRDFIKLFMELCDLHDSLQGNPPIPDDEADLPDTQQVESPRGEVQVEGAPVYDFAAIVAEPPLVGDIGTIPDSAKEAEAPSLTGGTITIAPTPEEQAEHEEVLRAIRGMMEQQPIPMISVEPVRLYDTGEHVEGELSKQHAVQNDVGI
jgi:hypothetical protein